MTKHNEQYQAILAELMKLRSDLRSGRLSAQNVDPAKPEPSERELRAFFDKVSGGRKPYTLVFDGLLQGRISLSTTRASALIVLLLDLQDRVEGGNGVLDITRLTQEACALLDGEEPGAPCENIANRVRAAFSRLASFVNGNPAFENGAVRLAVNPDGRCLRLADQSTGEPLANINLQVSTNDALVSRIIHKTLSKSPMAQLRKLKGMFCAGDDQTFDILNKEILNHKYPVNIKASVVRPLLQHYPYELVEYLGANPLRLERWKIADEAYRSGRLTCTEIMSRETLWEIITYKRGKGYLHYPSVKDDSMVAAVLDNLIARVSRGDGYRLILTEIPPIMSAINYEISLPDKSEVFTALFPISGHEDSTFPASLIVNSVIMSGTINDFLFEALIQRPTTVVDSKEVLAAIKDVRDHFAGSGRIEIE